MIDIGVASPSAQGQAMISTETAAMIACASAGSGPSISQTRKAASADRTTAGTNQDATRSASRCIGARDRCAAATMATMRASIASSPTFSARISRLPSPFMVPPVTMSSRSLTTGRDSPVSMLSSTVERPSSTTASTGTASPGRTRRVSPAMMFSSGASYSSPSGRTRRAVFGARSSRARIASPVRARARSSMTCPTSTRVTITTDASK